MPAQVGDSSATAGPLCRLDEIPEGGALAIDAAGEDAGLMLFRTGDSVVAYHNVCPHAGRRLDYAPGRFLLREGRVTCAVHGATFEIDGGACVAGPGGGALSAVSVRVADGWVWRA